jgi:putative DNA primase/helicase
MRREKDAATTARKLAAGEAVTGKKRLEQILGARVVGLLVKWLDLRGAGEEARLLDSSEDGLALAFVDGHKDDLRFTAAWHKWHRWDRTRWREDMTIKVFDLAREICRKAATGNPKRAKTLKAAHTVASVVSLASSDQRIAVVPDSWDSNKWLLNTPIGLVDLRTAEVKTHDPSAMITKITAVGPTGGCPMWKKHIELVTAGDRDLADYLQRFAGYSLTGETNEEALAFFYGTGQNGKDTFVTTLQLILGDYSRSGAMSTFTESKTERHPTDLAGLRGARMVVASETSGSSRWDEERIKLLTGGSVVSARFMRGDFFDYLPEFKLWIMGNHKPSLRHVDLAIRRRLHLIPFTVKIEGPDKNFKAKLRPEWPGILQWEIEGCLAWQRLGLSPPSAVINATDEYLTDQDTLGRWLAERCGLDPNAQTGSSAAYSDWKLWTEAGGEYTGSQKAFTQSLKEKGFKQKKDGTMYFVGFRLRS